MNIKIRGKGKPIVGIIACLHGNELLGEKIVNSLKKIKPLKGTLIFILANEEAKKIGKRFIDQDLNRSFPGKKEGNHEEKLAVSLLLKLLACDYIIDLHSTTAETDNFVIFTKTDKKVKKLVSLIPLAKVVFWGNKVSRGNALIDNVCCGASVEFDRNTNSLQAAKIIKAALINLGVLSGKTQKVSQEFYSACGVIKRKREINLKLKNFKKTALNEEIFYPLLFGEKEYKNIVCIKAKKLN